MIDNGDQSGIISISISQKKVHPIMLDEIVVLTPEEAAEMLKVTAEEIIVEMDTGRLRSFPVGKERRTTKAFVYEMITASMSASIPPISGGGQSSTAERKDKPRRGIPSMEQLKNMIWAQVDPFDYQWPKTIKEAEGTGLYHYDEAYQCVIHTDSEQLTFVIGFCDQEGAGMMRRHCAVFKGEAGHTLYPIVQFLSANDFATSGMMASIIRTNGKKSVRPDEPVPPEYQTMPLGIYSEIVKGPRSWNCRCVKAHNTDFAVMVRHALLRMQGN